MANKGVAERRGFPVQSLRREVLTIYLTMTFATGTGLWTVNEGRGIASVADTATGVWTIRLTDRFYALMSYAASPVTADGNGSLVKYEVSGVAVNSTSDPLFVLKAFDAFSNDGTPADPEDGDKILLKLELAVSSNLG